MLELMHKKVFVTGGNGFLGKALLNYYKDIGVAVSGIDFAANNEFNVVAGDLCNTSQWQGLLEGCDLIIHTAAVVSNTGDYNWMWDVNVKATRDLIAAASKAGVKRFVQISSVAALGFDFEDGADETMPLRPVNHPYIDTKIASEHVALSAHGSGEIEAVVIRPGDIYGPASRPWVVMPLEMISKGQFLLPAHGKGIFSPVFISDVVDAIVLAGSAADAAGHIFNIDGGEQLSCENYFGLLNTMLGSTKKLTTLSTGLANLITDVVGGLQRIMGKPNELGRNTMGMFTRKGGYSIAKAQRILGYQPKVNLQEGMQKVEAWANAEGLLQNKEDK